MDMGEYRVKGGIIKDGDYQAERVLLNDEDMSQPSNKKNTITA